MSQSLSQSFLAITRNSTDFEWLQGALAHISKMSANDAVSFPSLIDRTGRARFYRHRPCICFLEGTL